MTTTAYCRSFLGLAFWTSDSSIQAFPSASLMNCISHSCGYINIRARRWEFLLPDSDTLATTSTDFSVGGKNRGRNGDNGKLSQSYVSLIIENRPDFFLFENVKGLWRTKRHREFYEELKDLLHHAGYATTERLTNSLEFGAPQDRDRILLFGVRKDLLPSGAAGEDSLRAFPWERYITEDLETIKGLPWPDHSPFVAGSNTEIPVELVDYKELTVQYWFDKNDVSHHPNSKRFFTPRQGAERMKTVDEGDVSKKSYKRLHRWRYSPTVAYGNNEVHLHPYLERRLSVSEALSLQSLPKEYELPNDMTLSDSFKTIGNGVPYLLAKGVALTIRDYLDATFNMDALRDVCKSDKLDG